MLDLFYMAFSSLGDNLKQQMGDDKSLQSQIDATQALVYAEEVFVELFGDVLARQAKPLYLKNRTLTITCASSTIAQEIRLNQGPIVEKINTLLGKKEVDRLRYLA